MMYQWHYYYCMYFFCTPQLVSCSTIMGKAFAIGYALVGIPIFMWYIVKLGGLFRVIVIKIVAAAINCVWLAAS